MASDRERAHPMDQAMDTPSSPAEDPPWLGSHSINPSRFLEAALPQLDDAIVVFSPSTLKILDVSRGWISRYGYSRDQISAMGMLDLHLPAERDQARQWISRGPEQSSPPFIHVDNRGRQLPVQLQRFAVHYKGAPAWACLIAEKPVPRHPGNELPRTGALYREMFDRSLAGLYCSTVDGIMIECNDAFARMLDYPSPAMLVGFDCRLFYPGDDERRNFISTLARKNEVTNLEICLLRRDGRPVWLLENANLLQDKDGKAFIQGSVVDISERKALELALSDSQQRLALHVERTPLGVIEFDREGVITAWNPAAEKIFGFSWSEIIGKPAEVIVPPEARPHVARVFVDLLRATGGARSDNQNLTQDGRIISCEWYNTPLVDSAGVVIGVASLVLDVTERLHAQRALAESNDKFRAVTDTASSAIYIFDGDKFLYCNRATEQIIGYPRAELLAMDPMDIVHPDSRDMVRRRSEARFSGLPVPARYEFMVITRTGETRWLDFSGSLIDFEGKRSVLGTAFDVTSRKRVEQLQSALYRIADHSSANDRLEDLFSAVHGIIGELMYARNFYIALYDPDAGMMSFPYFVDEAQSPPPSRPLRKGLTEYVLRTGLPLLASTKVFDDLVRRGEVVLSGAPSVDWLGAPLKVGNEIFGVLALQIYNPALHYGERETELLTFVSQHVAAAVHRKRNEDRMRASEARYRSLVQGAVYGIYRSGIDDKFLDVNPALVAMLGYDSEEELLRQSLSRDVYVDPGELQRLTAEYKTHDRMDSVESRWKRKDGSIITVRLSGRVVQDESGPGHSLEMIAEDVTERRGLEDQLRQAVKMEAVGRLAGGVAHDFNNLLTVIKGYSEMMYDQIDEANPLRRDIGEINQAADRAANLTRQLLAFSRQQVLTPRVLNLNSVIWGMNLLLRKLLGEGVALHIVQDPAIKMVKADPGQVEQVIMNLAVNARDAIAGPGNLTIETANAVIDEIWAREYIGMKPGSYVLLAVSDNGSGMDRETQARIFEPFFTTKEQGKGTGLGLSMVYGIVKQSGGYIWVYSELGIGTTFKVYLPQVEQPLDPVVPPLLAEESQRGTETILLVEDEAGVRTLVSHVLTSRGYAVLEASTSAEATLIFQRQSGAIHMLLTDVMLEGSSGRELAEQLLLQKPAMKVLFVSGYTDDAVVHLGVLSANTAFLQKPFTTKALLAKVRSVLGNPPETGDSHRP